MVTVSPSDLDSAISDVLKNLVGINELYPGQYQLLQSLMENESVFYTSCTNSGKTLPTMIYTEILKKLNILGYKFPARPKVLFLTALNSLKLSLISNVKHLGIDCESVTSENVKDILESDTAVLFISPEVFKIPAVTKNLLDHRTNFVLKVVDEAHLGNYLS